MVVRLTRSGRRGLKLPLVETSTPVSDGSPHAQREARIETTNKLRKRNERIGSPHAQREARIETIRRPASRPRLQVRLTHSGRRGLKPEVPRQLCRRLPSSPHAQREARIETQWIERIRTLERGSPHAQRE